MGLILVSFVNFAKEKIKIAKFYFLGELVVRGECCFIFLQSLKSLENDIIFKSILNAKLFISINLIFYFYRIVWVSSFKTFHNNHVSQTLLKH